MCLRDSTLLLPRERFRTPCAPSSVLGVIVSREVPEHRISQITANSLVRRATKPEGVTLWFSRRVLHGALKS